MIRTLCDAINGSGRSERGSLDGWWIECWSLWTLGVACLGRGRGPSTRHLKLRVPCRRLRCMLLRACFLILWDLQPRKGRTTQLCQDRFDSAGNRQAAMLCDAPSAAHADIRPLRHREATKVLAVASVDEPHCLPGLNRAAGQVHQHVSNRAVVENSETDEVMGKPSGALSGYGTSTWHQHHTCFRPVAMPKPAHIRRRSAHDVHDMDDDFIAQPLTKLSHRRSGQRRGIRHSKPPRRCFSWPATQQESQLNQASLAVDTDLEILGLYGI